eukprot:4328709-Amphidinium_carterae.1
MSLTTPSFLHEDGCKRDGTPYKAPLGNRVYSNAYNSLKHALRKEGVDEHELVDRVGEYKFHNQTLQSKRTGKGWHAHMKIFNITEQNKVTRSFKQPSLKLQHLLFLPPHRNTPGEILPSFMCPWRSGAGRLGWTLVIDSVSRVSVNIIGAIQQRSSA